MSDYEQTAYDYAKAQGWSAAQVADVSYQQVATVCRVTLGVNDSSPEDFHYKIICRLVANRLRQEEEYAANEARREAIWNKAKELAEFTDATVTRLEPGDVAESGGWLVTRTEAAEVLDGQH